MPKAKMSSLILIFLQKNISLLLLTLCLLALNNTFSATLQLNNTIKSTYTTYKIAELVTRLTVHVVQDSFFIPYIQ